MKKDLISSLRCPARDCGSGKLRVEARLVEPIAYRQGTIEEVREGEIVCATCGRRYPIEDYVPSFEQLFPPELLEEACYWSDWYGFFWDRGYRGFFDLRAPSTPFIARGIDVPGPNSLSGEDLPGTHTELADHPLVREAQSILDVGVGCGWSSLYLARRGHNVVAFDPSAGNVRRAKLYAISQGEYVEYMATGLGFLDFAPGTFDGVFALHSIHHVPDLRGETAILRDWLRDGGVIAVDEHVQTDLTLSTVMVELEKRFGSEAAPRFTTLSGDDFAGLPVAHHSKMEDAGSADVLDALAGNFSIERFGSRFVSLDPLSFIYYLWHDRDLDAYRRAGEMVNGLYEARKEAYPGRVEYVTVLGRKSAGPGPAMPQLCRTRDLIARQSDGSAILDEIERALSTRGLDESEWLGLELAASTEAIWRLYRDGVTLSADVAVLQDTVEGLNHTIHTKDRHIAHLEGIISRLEADRAANQFALAAQADLLRRIESGRLMRLVNRLTMGGRRPKPKAQASRSRLTSHVSRITHRPSSLVHRLISLVRKPAH
jgi:SAM-dependent methyltransferase